jgi:toxin-antitoxin system PIN domain toxin
VTTLLDANVLIGLVIPEHVHHIAARSWFLGSTESFATCPITEGSLIRELVREGALAEAAITTLANIHNHPRHEFWEDHLSYLDVSMTAVVGHRQVTDAYLVQLARTRGARLVSFDRGLAALHGDVVDLLPTA